LRVPDLVIVGSHCTGLDLVTARAGTLPVLPCARLPSAVWAAWRRPSAPNAISRRSTCFDDKTETYNTPFLGAGARASAGLAADAVASYFAKATNVLKV